MQKDLYAQALIDAKAVRASATAIAKASLQEAFAPQISELVRQSLAEKAEEIEEVEEIEEAEEIEESEEEMEESTLEEILAELDGMEEEEADPAMQEDPGNLDEEEEEIEEAEEEETEEEETEEEEDGMEDGEIEDEAPEMGEEDEEIVITLGQLKQALAPFMGGEEAAESEEETDLDLDEILGEEEVEEEIEEGKEEEIEEARKTIEELSATLNEVNLLNAKLLYMNKIFKAKSLSEAQKQKVVSAFDRATSVKETKNVYTTLSESIAIAPKKQLKESIGYASKPAGYAPKTQIAEADPFISRMQRLAGIN